MPSKTGICSPQSSGRPTIKCHWTSRWDFLGIPSWEAWHVVQNLHNSMRNSLTSFSQTVWACPLLGIFPLAYPATWHVFIPIFTWLVPSWHLCLSLNVTFSAGLPWHLTKLPKSGASSPCHSLTHQSIYYRLNFIYLFIWLCWVLVVTHGSLVLAGKLLVAAYRIYE